ncbi:MAG: PorV/PorQ family protein [candidate division Zixibacteria bacterium]|nr:PorV/PorQ family protein [candidate division Zixibacteria bacterium]
MKKIFSLVKSVWLIVLVILLSSAAFGASIPDKAGTSGLSFLKLGIGARPTGMGEAFTAISGDIFSLYWNPAGVARHTGTEFAFMHNQWFQDVSLEYAALCFGYKKNVFGLGLTLSQVTNLERREGPTENPISYFDEHDLSLAFSWGRKLNDKFDLGISTKFLYEKIDFSSATGLGFDLGAVYLLRPDIQIGGAILNLGSKMKFEQEEFNLPTRYKVGAAYLGHEKYFNGDFILSLDLVKPNDNDLKVHLGGEYTYKEKFTLRSGYQIGYDDKNISLGLGLKIKKYAIDYAFVPFSSDIGNSHRISVNLKL